MNTHKIILLAIILISFGADVGSEIQKYLSGKKRGTHLAGAIIARFMISSPLLYLAYKS